MPPKNPGLKPVNLITGENKPPPAIPPLIPPPPLVPKSFTPVVSNFGAASGTRPISQQGESRSGDGFQLGDLFGPKRSITEFKAFGNLVSHAVPGLVTLAGGVGVDLYHVVLNDFTGNGYSMETSKELAKGFASTFTPGHYVDYWHAIQRGEAITPLLIQDAGNLSLVGSVVGKGLTAGAVSARIGAEAAAKAAAAGGAAETVAQAAAKASRLTARAAKLSDTAATAKTFTRRMNKPMEYTFKPYIWAGKGLQTAYKTGAIPYFYDFKNGVPVTWETNMWGATAAAKYAEQIAEYHAANPEATMADGTLRELVNKFNRHADMGRSTLKSAVIRRAARDAIFDGSQTFRALIKEKINPAHSKDINPETGEVWGELSAVEQQALLATINGRAQLIKAMSEKTGLSPSQLAILGRVDWMPEYHLSPAGAELAVRFVNGDASLSAMQYDRLNGAIEGIGKSIENITNKSLAGYGRQTKMPLDYTVPTPHVKQLFEAIKKSGNEDAMAIFKLAEESEIWDLPLNDPLRRNLIMRLVELLPDDIALDPSLYPAIERENLAFFNRVRKAIDNGEVGKILGEPMPEGPFGPDDYTIAPNKGRSSKAQAMIEAGRQKVRKLENTILKIAAQIDKVEAAHSQKVDLVRRNDMVDAYVAGAAPKALARKYRMPLSEVEKVLAKHPVSRAWREVLKTQEAMASFERVIGKKRAAMSEGELAVEADSMRNELEMRRQDAENAKRNYESMVQVNETLRQTVESGIDLDVEQHERLYDDLYNAELELEIAGGNLEDIQISLDEIPDNSPMTIGRAGAHVTELTRIIDQVFSKEPDISPELAADVQRVKVVMNSAWKIAEDAFYNSPTEQLTAVAQARINQLGLLYESIIKSATDATSLVDQTLRNKTALDIASGVISPFTRRPGDIKPLLSGNETTPTRDTWDDFVYETENVVSFNLDNDISFELKNIIDTVKAPDPILNKDGSVNFVQDVVVDYGPIGHNAEVRISFLDEGTAMSARLSFASKDINLDFYVDLETELSNTVTARQVMDVYDRLILEWENYKLDPKNNEGPSTEYNSENYFPNVDFGYIDSVEIEFDYPAYQGNEPMFREKAAKFDAQIEKFKSFSDELFGPRDIVDPSQALLSPPKVVDNGLLERQQKWKQETFKKYADDFDEGVAGISKTVDRNMIIKFAERAGENLKGKTLMVTTFIDEIVDSFQSTISEITNFKDQVLAVIEANDGPTAVVELQNIQKELKKLVNKQKKVVKNLESSPGGAFPKTEMGVQKTLELIYEMEISRIERLVKEYDSAPDFVKTKTVTAERAPALAPEESLPLEQQPLRAPDVVGAVELTPELEGYARTAADDPELLDDLRMERDDALALERDIERAKNPTPENIKAFREEQLKSYNQELIATIGLAQSNLGAGINLRNGMPKWALSPVKGVPEWDWWFKGLDAKQRQVIARDFFRTTPFKNPTFSGPRYLRKGLAIDGYADDANMTVDQFGEAILENIAHIQKVRGNIRSLKATEDAILGDRLSKIDLDELTSYQNRMSMSGSEYEAVVARAENLAGLKPDPIAVEKLRPVANTPDEVTVDISITSKAVRDAAYESDVIDAMAKEATKKMKSAERLSDRLAALDEFITLSAKYREQSQTLIQRQNSSKKVRLQQIKREEKLRNLREKQRLAINQSRRLTKVLDTFEASPGLMQFESLDKGLPLRTALEPGYPSEQFPVEYVTPEGVAESFDLSGPMYLPTGLGEEYVGGLTKTTAREGLGGHNKSTNEHYRQGDRHTIFSIRQIADRLARDMSNMTLNDKFRQVIASFGKKVSDILDEQLILDLRAKAERKATATPYEIATEARDAGLLDEDGLQAYNAGLENPQKYYDLAVAIEFGKLLNLEMNIRGYDAVDPYSPLETRIGISRINEEAMFVENGIKEAIAKQVQIFDPTRMDRAWRAMGSVTSFFKVSTLALSVMWQLGDIISTFMIASYVGVNPLDLIARMKQVKAEEYGPGLRNLFDPKAELPPVEGYTTIAVESPTQDVGLSQEEILTRRGQTAAQPKESRLNRVTRGAVDYPEWGKGRNPAKLNFKLNETINRISRHAFFLELLEKRLAENGLTIDTVFNDKSWRNNPEIHDIVFEVADSANKWLGDFSDLSMAERKYITSIYPFYAWMKHIHKVFYAIGVEHPQSLAWHVYIGSLNFDPNEDPMGLRTGTFGLFGGLASMNFANPFADVIEGPVSYLLTGDRSKITRGMGPVPRLALGLTAGFDIANFQDVQRPAESYSKSRIGQNVAPFITDPSSVLGFTANQFPIIKRGLQALPQGEIPFTDIATGSVSTYPTGQARLNPYTNKPIGKWGGQLAAVGRLFSLPGIPYQTDKQIKEVEDAARKRLRQIEAKQGR